MTNSDLSKLFTIIVPSKEWTKVLDEMVTGAIKIYPKIQIICILDEMPKIEISYPLKLLIKKGNISQKRNFGVKQSKTDFVIFIDSDARFCAGAIENAYQRFQESEDIAIVGGPNLFHPNSTEQQRLTYLASKSIMVGGKNRYEKDNKYIGFVRTVPSCNMYVRKKIYEEVGGMNENMRTGEDLEFCFRVGELGEKIFFDNQVCVEHYTRDLKGLFKQRVVWGFNVFNILKYAKFVRNSYMILPFICILLALVLLFSSQITILLFLISLYFIILLIESSLLTRSFVDFMKLPLYLLVGNISSGVGVFLFLIRPNFNIYKIYNNN